MSSIGSGYGALPVNPYAGRAGSDTDGSKVAAVDRATDSDHEKFSDNLAGANQSEKSGDRDADGQAAGRARRRQEAEENADDSKDGGSVAARPKSVDEHRGNLIDFEA